MGLTESCDVRSLHVPDGVREYPPFGANTTSWYTHRLATALTYSGCIADVVSLPCESGTFSYRHLALGPRPSGNQYRDKVAFGLALRARLGQMITERNYGVVHFHSILPTAISLDSVKAHAATVVTWGDPLIGVMDPIASYLSIPRLVQMRERPGRLLSVVAQKHVLENVDSVVAVSAYLKKRLCGLFGVSEKKVEVVPPAVDSNRFKPNLDVSNLRMRYSVRAEEQVLVCPARITPVKRQHDLILACSYLTREGANVRLFLVGALTDMGYYEYLRTEVRRLGLLSRVVFTGIVEEDDFPLYYNLADIVVLPSIGEGFASSLLEAMSCGRPVVATDISPNREAAVTGRELGFVAPRNPRRLADVILSLLRDPPAMRKMSEAGRESAISQFSWGSQARRLMGIYSRLA